MHYDELNYYEKKVYNGIIEQLNLDMRMIETLIIQRLSEEKHICPDILPDEWIIKELDNDPQYKAIASMGEAIRCKFISGK